MGSLSVKVDSQRPTITGTLSGIPGSNSWYTSPVVFNGSASDLTSGLASFGCTLDGVPLSKCNSVQISGQGLHSLVLTAQDNAGLIRYLTQNTSIDTHPPALSVSLAGTRGSNTDWYTDAALNGSASDDVPGSGLSAIQYKLDEGPWVAFPSTGVLSLPEG
ncbi:MAG: hypothetical protein ACM3PS_17080, partial [Syntrophothermus sp.]